MEDALLILYSRKIALLIFIAIFFTAHQSLSAPSVSSVSGTISHGSTVTVSGSGFGTKANSAQDVPAAPLVWDITSAQYVGGVNRNAFAGFGDGASVESVKTVWGQFDGSQGVVKYTTSRPHRHSRIAAHYAVYDEVSPWLHLDILSGDDGLADGTLVPPWLHIPGQRKFYLSFYRKLKNCGWSDPPDGPPVACLGGGDGSTKIVRIGTEPWSGIVGSCFLTPPGYGWAGVDYSWTSGSNSTDWERWEVYVDLDKNWFDAYRNGHYYQGDGSTVELRPAADWRFNPPHGDYQFTFEINPGDSIVPAQFGYDDGHGNSQGQEIDVGEIYYDATCARVEISDQPTWNDSPTSTANREVQGRLLTWSDNQITLELYQGVFDTLAGKYLYVIDEDGSVNTNGYLLSDASSGLPFIGNGGTFTLGTGGTIILQ